MQTATATVTPLDAVQPQPAGAVTFTLPVPPVEVNDPEVAEREKEHATPASLRV